MKSWKQLLALVASLSLIDLALLTPLGVPFPLRLLFSFGYGWFFNDLLNLLGIDLGQNDDE